jgi:phenylacetate-coenzyme A ligase PaaK-like adenylate-forming protein
MLVAYASMASLLAAEQLAGRLRIAPRAVLPTSEALSRDERERIRRAWGVEPFDVYVATETAGIASECARHAGLHLYEDLVIAEVVDESNRPVPPGEFGAKVLVTVLFSRTLPLIRYELSDSLRISPAACACGLPFRLVEAVEGRREDFVELQTRAGATMLVHPNVFHAALEHVPVAAWQVRADEGRIRVLLVGALESLQTEAVAADVARAIRQAGAEPPTIEILRVDAIPRTAIGKAPLVVALEHDAWNPSGKPAGR